MQPLDHALFVLVALVFFLSTFLPFSICFLFSVLFLFFSFIFFLFLYCLGFFVSFLISCPHPASPPGASARASGSLVSDRLDVGCRDGRQRAGRVHRQRGGLDQGSRWSGGPVARSLWEMPCVGAFQVVILRCLPRSGPSLSMLFF